jgi:hypothetical protein
MFAGEMSAFSLGMHGLAGIFFTNLTRVAFMNAKKSVNELTIDMSGRIIHIKSIDVFR